MKLDVANFTYLDPTEFSDEYDVAWQNVQQRLFKLETLQYYKCDEGPFFDAFKERDYRRFVDQLVSYFDKERSKHQKLKDRAIKNTRLHIVSAPLTEYLKFEVATYAFRQALGEDVLMLDISNAVPEFLEQDLILFDNHCLFVHDFTPEGMLKGVWKSEEVADAQQLELLTQEMADRAVPVTAYLDELDPELKPLIELAVEDFRIE